MVVKISDKSLSTINIAHFLNQQLIGDVFPITTLSNINNIHNGTVSFISNFRRELNHEKKALIIAPEKTSIPSQTQLSFILSKQPKLDFIRLANEFFYSKPPSIVAKTAQIGKNCTISPNVTIGEYSIIGDNVSIDSGTIINHHVTINANTQIGKDCYIKSGAIIGEEGFGFERDENSIPIRFPHFGNVIIGNNVEIGANTVIARGTLDSTQIQGNVKLDDCVFIAHNVHIEENTMIAACSEVSGSSRIGKNCWIGPNCTIKDQIIIGDNVFIGSACHVSKYIEANTTLGSMANLKLRDLAKLNNIIKNDK